MSSGRRLPVGPLSVVVVGGALMDLLAHSRAPLVPATSNPARIIATPGGVGRNVAENLARLGTPVHLVAVVGADAFGDVILQEAAEAGIGTEEVITGPQPTGTYLAVLDHDGELSVGLCDAAATDALTVARLEAARPRIEAAALLVVDGNLPLSCAVWLLDIAHAAGVPVVLEPVSVAKARRLGDALGPHRPVLVVTPNTDELAALAPDAADPAAVLHRLGVEHVWVRRGAEGSRLSSRGTGTSGLPGRPVTVVDVTGAGDAMTAGFVHALLGGAPVAQSAAYGQAAAELTVASPHTVRPDLSDALVRAHLDPTPGDRP